MPRNKTPKTNPPKKARSTPSVTGIPVAELDQLSPVAREQLENFCRELALDLRRITGRVPDERQMDLPKAV